MTLDILCFFYALPHHLPSLSLSECWPSVLSLCPRILCCPQRESGGDAAARQSRVLLVLAAAQLPESVPVCYVAFLRQCTKGGWCCQWSKHGLRSKKRLKSSVHPIGSVWGLLAVQFQPKEYIYGMRESGNVVTLLHFLQKEGASSMQLRRVQVSNHMHGSWIYYRRARDWHYSPNVSVEMNSHANF